MILKDILSGISPIFTSGGEDQEIQSLGLDSRKSEAYSLFFTLPGSRTDGNRYVRQAIEKGAVAILSELKMPPAPMALVRPGTADSPVAWIQVKDVFKAMGRAASNFYNDPSADLTVVGVTGTNGKTTTTYFLESIFSCAGGVPGVIGTVSHRLRHREIEKAANTTPYSLDLLRLLARMRDSGGTHAAIEVSSHALATQRAEEVHFDAAILTNIQSDHLDFHKTKESYFEAKAHLFELLQRADSHKKTRIAVIPKDDEVFELIKHRVLDMQIIGYGYTPEADYIAEGIAGGVHGMSFRIRRRAGGEWAARICLPGEHNIHNALAAAACAHELGISPEQIIEGLARLKEIPGRLQSIAGGQGFSVFVDFAHTESALTAVLESLHSLPHRKIITVFGCGGDRDVSKRGPMGTAACAGSDLAIATSDNPRDEEPMQILRGIEEGMRQGGYENYRIIPDRREAIQEAIKIAQQEDIVLIAGKGHERTQILKSKTVSFDDAEVARSALKECGRI